MKKYASFEDLLLLDKKFKGIKKIKQDIVFHKKDNSLNTYCHKKSIYQQEFHSFFFKNDYSIKYIKKNPVFFVRKKSLYNELIKLKNENYIPEILLDLHGCTQQQAKKEIGKLIFICHKKNFFCCAIVHGHGKNILKNQIPIWLSQHPDIIAFYQAPKVFGNNTTLFVFIENK